MLLDTAIVPVSTITFIQGESTVLYPTEFDKPVSIIYSMQGTVAQSCFIDNIGLFYGNVGVTKAYLKKTGKPHTYFLKALETIEVKYVIDIYYETRVQSSTFKVGTKTIPIFWRPTYNKASWSDVTQSRLFPLMDIPTIGENTTVPVGHKAVLLNTNADSILVQPDTAPMIQTAGNVFKVDAFKTHFPTRWGTTLSEEAFVWESNPLNQEYQTHRFFTLLPGVHDDVLNMYPTETVFKGACKVYVEHSVIAPNIPTSKVTHLVLGFPNAIIPQLTFQFGEYYSEQIGCTKCKKNLTVNNTPIDMDKTKEIIIGIEYNFEEYQEDYYDTHKQ
jgi:hypothetical protein